jgi:tRNA threonylcarbamoyl adenosine modification protein (Sua5/YciO/YrdC/YwlC family)
VDAVVERVVRALRAGESVLLPTDGVYGLCSLLDPDAAEALYEVKGRSHLQPTAVIGASVDRLLEFVPELEGRSLAIVRALLPGPYTLVLPNPAGRWSWLAGDNPLAIGVRVARLPAASQRVLDEVGAVAATSANEPGEPPAAGLDDVPARIRAECGAEVDAGRLPGTASTVLDFTGAEPRVLREGAAPSADALSLVAAALADEGFRPHDVYD